MADLDYWERIVISAIENPQDQTANFEELREKVLKENKGSGEKIVFENEKSKLILKIKWDKNKFFFLYNSVVIDKRLNKKNKRVIGVDEAHGYRHLHSGKFRIPNPMTLIEKLEHPILSLIIKSERGDRKKVWIKKLANELKNSQINWKNHLIRKESNNLGRNGNKA